MKALACIISLVLPALGILTSQRPLLHGAADSHTCGPPPDFEVFVNKTLVDFETPGLAVAIICGEKIWSAGYGFADLDTRQPVTNHTLFQGGSTTKSFMAALVSMLVYGKDSSTTAGVKWSTPLSQLIRDDFILQDGYATEHVTVADALSHRTGMPRHDISWVNGNLTVRDIVRSMRHLPLHNEIRTAYEYCNIMFSTISHVLEMHTGARTAHLLRSWIWDLIGMNETVYSTHEALAMAQDETNDVTLASGYYYDETTKTQVQVPWDSMSPANGAGGVVSTVLDYAKWVRQFLATTGAEQSLLDPRAVEQMTYAHASIPPNGRPWTGQSFYGFGLEHGVYRGHRLIGHDGAESGYMSRMQWIPELDWGFVVMHNSYRLAYEPVGWHLVDHFLNVPQAERFDGAAWAMSLKQAMDYRNQHAREILFPGSPEKPKIAPSLALKDYAGLYHHPAYHNLTLSKEPTERFHSCRESRSENVLFLSPSTVSYENINGVLEHINGEFWLAHVQSGPPAWLSNRAIKVEFDIGPNGRVKKMGFQAEEALEASIWFEKWT